MTGTFQPAQSDAYFSSTASTPGFWRPIELSIPAGVSVTRGGWFPMRGRRVVPLQQIAPSRSTSTTSPYSTPYPNVPDATSTGLRSTSRPGRPGARSTDRSTAASSAAEGPVATDRAPAGAGARPSTGGRTGAGAAERAAARLPTPGDRRAAARYGSRGP